MSQPVPLLPVHPRTFIAVDPRTRQRSLLAEVRPETERDPSEDELRAFQERLFDRGIRVGLFVTPTTMLVVQDRLSSMDFATNDYETKSIGTQDLLTAPEFGGHGAPRDFVAQVRAWLRAISTSWTLILPHSAFDVFVPDVVGCLSQADFEEWDDVLGSDDTSG